MALNDNKVTTGQISSYGVVAAPDRLTGTAAQNKAVFDRLIREVIAESVNGLIGALQATTAASELGASVPSVATKTVQAVLSSFETAIANRYTKAEVDALTGQETNSLVADVDVNLSSGVIKVTKKDGTVETFDTALEKVPARFEIVNSGGAVYLKIINVDGSSTQTDITSLMNVYQHANSDEIAWTETGAGNVKTVTASIRANSIGMDKLSLSVTSVIEGYVAEAADSAITAAAEAAKARDSATTSAARAGEAAASAREAAGSVTASALKAAEASQSADQAAAKAIEAGQSAGRAASEADRAEYYAGIAKDVSGGDYATTTELRGVIKVGGNCPLVGPCLWFDTSLPVAATLALGPSGEGAEITVAVDGETYPVKNAAAEATPTAGKYNFEIV